MDGMDGNPRIAGKLEKIWKKIGGARSFSTGFDAYEDAFGIVQSDLRQYYTHYPQFVALEFELARNPTVNTSTVSRSWPSDSLSKIVYSVIVPSSPVSVRGEGVSDVGSVDVGDLGDVMEELQGEVECVEDVVAVGRRLVGWVDGCDVPGSAVFTLQPDALASVVGERDETNHKWLLSCVESWTTSSHFESDDDVEALLSSLPSSLVSDATHALCEWVSAFSTSDSTAPSPPSSFTWGNGGGFGGGLSWSARGNAEWVIKALALFVIRTPNPIIWIHPSPDEMRGGMADVTSRARLEGLAELVEGFVVAVRAQAGVGGDHPLAHSWTHPPHVLLNLPSGAEESVGVGAEESGGMGWFVMGGEMGVVFPRSMVLVLLEDDGGTGRGGKDGLESACAKGLLAPVDGGYVVWDSGVSSAVSSGERLTWEGLMSSGVMDERRRLLRDHTVATTVLHAAHYVHQQTPRTIESDAALVRVALSVVSAVKMTVVEANPIKRTLRKMIPANVACAPDDLQTIALSCAHTSLGVAATRRVIADGPDGPYLAGIGGWLGNLALMAEYLSQDSSLPEDAPGEREQVLGLLLDALNEVSDLKVETCVASGDPIMQGLIFALALGTALGPVHASNTLDRVLHPVGEWTRSPTVASFVTAERRDFNVWAEITRIGDVLGDALADAGWACSRMAVVGPALVWKYLAGVAARKTQRYADVAGNMRDAANALMGIGAFDVALKAAKVAMPALMGGSKRGMGSFSADYDKYANTCVVIALMEGELELAEEWIVAACARWMEGVEAGGVAAVLEGMEGMEGMDAVREHSNCVFNALYLDALKREGEGGRDEAPAAVPAWMAFRQRVLDEADPFPTYPEVLVAILDAHCLPWLVEAESGVTAEGVAEVLMRSWDAEVPFRSPALARALCLVGSEDVVGEVEGAVGEYRARMRSELEEWADHLGVGDWFCVEEGAASVVGASAVGASAVEASAVEEVGGVCNVM